MPVASYVMGPGTLQIGPSGTEKDFSCQIVSATLTPDKDEEDDLHTLCGDTVAGAVTYTWTLEGELVQDLTSAGVVKFCFDNAGVTLPFEFEPKTGTGLPTITGNLVVDPVAIGGEVKQKPTSEFEFKVVGTPVWTPQV